VVTGLYVTADQVYNLYRQRGDSEDRIKELKADLGSGRIGCQLFWANQLRVLMAAAAFMPIQELLVQPVHTSRAAAQAATRRLKHVYLISTSRVVRCGLTIRVVSRERPSHCQIAISRRVSSRGSSHRH
jgi:hypothetical protein